MLEQGQLRFGGTRTPSPESESPSVQFPFLVALTSMDLLSSETYDEDHVCPGKKRYVDEHSNHPRRQRIPSNVLGDGGLPPQCR